MEKPIQPLRESKKIKCSPAWECNSTWSISWNKLSQNPERNKQGASPSQPTEEGTSWGVRTREILSLLGSPWEGVLLASEGLYLRMRASWHSPVVNKFSPFCGKTAEVGQGSVIDQWKGDLLSVLGGEEKTCFYQISHCTKAAEASPLHRVAQRLLEKEALLAEK